MIIPSKRHNAHFSQREAPTLGTKLLSNQILRMTTNAIQRFCLLAAFEPILCNPGHKQQSQ